MRGEKLSQTLCMWRKWQISGLRKAIHFLISSNCRRLLFIHVWCGHASLFWSRHTHHILDLSLWSGLSVILALRSVLQYKCKVYEDLVGFDRMCRTDLHICGWKWDGKKTANDKFVKNLVLNICKGLSGKETKYLCFCLWPTGNRGIPVTTVRIMSSKIFSWEFYLESESNSGTGTGIWNTGTGYPVPAQILGFCSSQPLHGIQDMLQRVMLTCFCV